MIRNPELLRNAWLELTPHRLLATPVVFLLVLALLVSTADAWRSVASGLALAGFVLVSILWGGRRSYDAIVDEVRTHTWDVQRMSALGPWEMTWGKLLGSNLYNWYAGGHCLAVTAFTYDQLAAGREWPLPELCLLLVLSALFVQGVSLVSGLTAARSGRTVTPSRNLPIALLGLLILFWLGQVVMQHGSHPVTWYGRLWDGPGFVLASLAVFTAWAWFGAYRLMSELLAVRLLPWGALGFVVFLTAYVCGFMDDALWGGYPSRFAAIGALVGGVAAYGEAWKERRDWIAVRRFVRAWRDEPLPRALWATPDWLVVALFALTMAVATALLPATRVYSLPGLSGAMQALTLSPIVFSLLMFRDIGLLYFFSLGERADRAASTTLVYLALLYAVLPALLNLANIGFLVFPPAYPMYYGNAWGGIAIAAGHVAAVGWLLRRRLRKAPRT